MLTYLGKFLVLLNAFAAVAVGAWSVAAYTTRVDAADAVDQATGEKWDEQVKAWAKKAADAQGGYAPALREVTAAEARLDDLRQKITARLAQADGGVFYDIYETPPAGAKDPANPYTVERVGRLYWGEDPKRVIKGLNDKPLAGVDQMRKNLSDEQAAALSSVDNTQKAVSALTQLNAEITALDARQAWLQEVVKRHEVEIPVLNDLRVNWENRGGSLQRRRDQLLLRLDDLRGAKVGAVTPPALPSALTVNPPIK